MTGRRVLVLRPEPGASETASRLVAAGFEPVVMPLSEIVPISPAASIDISGVTHIAATSANGLRHAPLPLLAAIRGKPLFAVGEATAQAARDAGFSDVTAGADDGGALAQQILDRGLHGRLLYLCGSIRRPEFERTLRARRRDVLAVEVYRAVAIDQTRPFAVLAEAGSPLVAMCHSPEAARMLAGLVEGVPGLAQRMRVIAISARAAQPLIAVGVAVDVASEPTDRAILAVLG